MAFAIGVLGGDVALVGAAGKDFDDYRGWLGYHGVDCESVLISESAYTARFVCTTDEDMAQIASFYPGAMSESRNIKLADVVSRTDHRPSHRRSQRPRCDVPAHRRMPRPRTRLRRGSVSAAGPPVGGGDPQAHRRRHLPLHQRLRVGPATAEVGPDRSRGDEPDRPARHDPGPKGVDLVSADGTSSTSAWSPRPIRPTRPASATPPGPASSPAAPPGLSLERSAQLASLVAVLVLEATGPQEWSWDRDSRHHADLGRLRP